MPLVEMDYRGLRKVISGGQCGADEGGIFIAKNFGLETGGWIPRGWKTANGPRPDLGTTYGLKEAKSDEYKPRTVLNIKDSDGTIVVASNPDSPGCRLTINTCRQLSKPCFWTLPKNVSKALADNVANWIVEQNIEVLNVAGNRDFQSPVHFDYTTLFLGFIFDNLDNRGLLVKRHA